MTHLALLFLERDMAKQTVSKRTKQTLAGFVVATALAIGGYYFNQPTVKEATDQVVFGGD